MPTSIYSKHLHKRKHMPIQRYVHECILFITARNWRKSKHLFIKWINKQQYFNQYHFIIKMNKIFPKKIHSQQVCEKMLNIISHERNSTQTHKIILSTHQDGYNFFKCKITSIGETVKRVDPSMTSLKQNVKFGSCCEKQFGISLKS